MTLSRHTTGGILPCKAYATKLASCVLPFSPVQDRIYTLEKAHMRCTPSRRSFPSVSFKTVPMLVWLTLSCLSKRIFVAKCFLFLCRSPPGSWRYLDLTICTHSWWIKLLNATDLTSHKPPVMVTLHGVSISLVISLHLGMSKTVCPQESVWLWCKRCNDYYDDDDDNVKPLTAMEKEHPRWKTALAKEHLPRWKTALAKEHLNERPPWQKNTSQWKNILPKEHPSW